MTGKIGWVLCLWTFIHCVSSAQNTIKIEIDSERKDGISLSALSDKPEAILLKNDLEAPIQRVSQVLDAGEHLVVVDSHSAKDAFPRRVSLFSRQGEFISVISPGTRVAFDAQSKLLFVLQAEGISVYNLNGELQKTLKARQAANLFFYDGALWLQTRSVKEGEGTAYALLKVDPEKDKARKVYGFFEGISDSLPLIISTISRFSVSPNGLVNAFGLPDQINVIKTDKVEKPYQVSISDWPKRYMDHYQASYEFIGEYLSGKYLSQGRYSGFLFHTGTGNYYHFPIDASDQSVGIQDDYYQTGSWQLRALNRPGGFYAVKYANEINKGEFSNPNTNELVIFIGKLRKK